MPLVAIQLPGMGMTYLDQRFFPRVTRFIAEASSRGVMLHFNEAFRPPGAQAAMRANPRAITPATAGSSLHEAGFAVDVNYSSLRNVPGGMTGDQQRQAIREAARAAGLHWGGGFSHTDPPHFYYDPGGNRRQLVLNAQAEYLRIPAPHQPHRSHHHHPHHHGSTHHPSPTPHPTPSPSNTPAPGLRRT